METTRLFGRLIFVTLCKQYTNNYAHPLSELFIGTFALEIPLKFVAIGVSTKISPNSSLN